MAPPPSFVLRILDDERSLRCYIQLEVNTLTNRQADMLKFYLPLAATSMLMMASHSFVSSGLARTPDASAALAAFALAQSLAVMFESPCYTIQRMCVALFKDQASYAAVKRTTIAVWATLTAVMLAIAFTPLGKVAFMQVLKVPPELYVDTVRSFRVFLLLPAFSAFRSFYQGLLITSKRTSLLTINMLFRLAVMLTLATILPRLNFSGGAVGAVILSAGIGTEAFMAYITGRKFKQELPPSGENCLTSRQAMLFFVPLALASITNTFVRPIINAGLARTIDPSVALASYQVAWSFSYIFAAVAFNIHQLAIVFGREKEHRSDVLRFSLLMGALGSLVLFTVAVTPIGTFILTRIIGLTPELAAQALRTILILSLLPVLTCVSEYCVGLLILAGQTKYLTASKALHIVTILITSILITRFAPHLGGQLAGVCMVSGITVEAIFVSYQLRSVSAAKASLSA